MDYIFKSNAYFRLGYGFSMVIFYIFGAYLIVFDSSSDWFTRILFSFVFGYLILALLKSLFDQIRNCSIKIVFNDKCVYGETILKRSLELNWINVNSIVEINPGGGWGYEIRICGKNEFEKIRIRNSLFSNYKKIRMLIIQIAKNNGVSYINLQNEK